MKRQQFTFALVSSLALIGLPCLAQDAVPVVPADGTVVESSGGSTTTTTETHETIKPKHHDDGLIPDAVGVTGKAVKETVGLPGKAVKETAKVLF